MYLRNSSLVDVAIAKINTRNIIGKTKIAKVS